MKGDEKMESCPWYYPLCVHWQWMDFLPVVGILLVAEVVVVVE